MAVTAVDATAPGGRGGDASAVVSDGSLMEVGDMPKVVSETIADVAAVGLTGLDGMHGDVYVNVWLVDDAVYPPWWLRGGNGEGWVGARWRR